MDHTTIDSTDSTHSRLHHTGLAQPRLRYIAVSEARRGGCAACVGGGARGKSAHAWEYSRDTQHVEEFSLSSDDYKKRAGHVDYSAALGRRGAAVWGECQKPEW